MEVLDERMKGNYMVITCTIIINFTLIKTNTLLDKVYTRYLWIDKSFARHHNRLLQLLQKSQTLVVIDSKTIAYGEITHICNRILDCRILKAPASDYAYGIDHVVTYATENILRRCVLVLGPDNRPELGQLSLTWGWQRLCKGKTFPMILVC